MPDINDTRAWPNGNYPQTYPRKPVIPDFLNGDVIRYLKVTDNDTFSAEAEIEEG